VTRISQGAVGGWAEFNLLEGGGSLLNWTRKLLNNRFGLLNNRSGLLNNRFGLLNNRLGNFLLLLSGEKCPVRSKISSCVMYVSITTITGRISLNKPGNPEHSPYQNLWKDLSLLQRLNLVLLRVVTSMTIQEMMVTLMFMTQEGTLDHTRHGSQGRNNRQQFSQQLQFRRLLLLFSKQDPQFRRSGN
jgi:hypothetical protein